MTKGIGKITASLLVDRIREMQEELQRLLPRTDWNAKKVDELAWRIMTSIASLPPAYRRQFELVDEPVDPEKES